MNKPVIHVAVMSEQRTELERVIVHRPITELVFVYSIQQEAHAELIIQSFQSLGIPVVPIGVASDNFDAIMTAVLGVLNDPRLDEYHIEFNLSASKGMMTVAACMAATIVNGTLVTSTANGRSRVKEVWPHDLVNMTQRKHDILKMLAGQSSPMCQSDVSKEMGIQQSGISRHIRDLVRAGYVRRFSHSRRKFVEITDLGAAVLHHKQIRKRRHWGSHLNPVDQSSHMVGRIHG